MANSYLGINPFRGVNSYDNIPSPVIPQQSAVAPIPAAKNYSIAELQSQIAPPPLTQTQQLFGVGDEAYVMPENQELTRQRNLSYEIAEKKPEVLQSINPGWYTGAGASDPLSLNIQAVEKSPMDDVFNARVLGPYSPLAHQNDPMVKYLNSKYKFGRGGWDLGDGAYYVPKKGFQGNNWYGVRGKTGNEEMDAPTFSQFIEKDWADTFTPEGTFNKEGWRVIKPNYDAIARKGIINTLAVIAPAIFHGLGMVGSGGEGAAAAGGGEAVAGSSAAIPAGSEGLMTGALATEAAPATAGGSSAGMFGNSNLNLGNSYLNAIGEGAIRNAITSGGDPKSILTGAITGGLGNSSGALAQVARQYGMSPSAFASLLSGGGRTISGLLGGENASSALRGGLTSGISKYVGNTLGDVTGIRPLGALATNLINTRDARSALVNTALGALNQYNQNSMYRR